MTGMATQVPEVGAIQLRTGGVELTLQRVLWLRSGVARIDAEDWH
jgi:hypothetical protein